MLWEIPVSEPHGRTEIERLIEDAGFTIIDDLLHGYGGGYLPPILGCKSRPAGPIPQEPFRAGVASCQVSGST